MTKALPQNAERRLLDYARLAAYLGISLRAAKAIGGPNGKIPRVEIGHRILFDREDVDRYVEKLKRSA